MPRPRRTARSASPPTRLGSRARAAPVAVPVHTRSATASSVRYVGGWGAGQLLRHVAAGGDEGGEVLDVQDVAHGGALVGGAAEVGLDDPVADVVAQVRGPPR